MCAYVYIYIYMYNDNDNNDNDNNDNNIDIDNSKRSARASRPASAATFFPGSARQKREIYTTNNCYC